MTPLERSARAVAEYTGQRMPPPGDVVTCEGIARAVLEAIRDVDSGSPAMLLAGKQSLYSCSEDPELDDARQCWQAMIDAALEE